MFNLLKLDPRESNISGRMHFVLFSFFPFLSKFISLPHKVSLNYTLLVLAEIKLICIMKGDRLHCTEVKTEAKGKKGTIL